MTEKKFYLILSSVLFALSFIFYLIYSETLIIYWNRNKNSYASTTEVMDKKKCSLYYWAHNRWQKEDKDVICGTNKIKSITNLIVSWLNLLEEENLSDKKISIQNILLDHSNNLYISFSQPIFKKQASIYTKLLWIHGLLKTLHVNSSIKHVQFLIQNRPINDRHIDFSQLWPVVGYLNSYS